jgi:hypothetical protein
LAQEKFTLTKNLRSDWMTFQDGRYLLAGEIPFYGVNTIYFQLDPQTEAGNFLRTDSSRPYFIFINGKVCGEFEGPSTFPIDSLLQAEGRTSWIAIRQKKINERDLHVEVISRGQRPAMEGVATAARPYSPFRDFVVISGLLIILLFLVAARLNPKLASDYFSLSRIFASRDTDDSQASARITGGSNVQFYVLCSLLIGFYLLIVLYHLPAEYALPIHFQASDFWMIGLQWLKLSTLVFLALLVKLSIIFSLTRLFNMRGMARFHFFNWVRLLLVAIGASTVFLFMYFISRGEQPAYYVMFLFAMVGVLIGWIVAAFFKLSGKSGHSMFHLFSYLCATEIIPLLITVKVLFQ